MTIKELIEQLKKHDENMKVVVSEEGITPSITIIKKYPSGSIYGYVGKKKTEKVVLIF